ncbi:MAG: hypothetical protein ABR511_00600 [Acidimicrobiales bacterium]
MGEQLNMGSETDRAEAQVEKAQNQAKTETPAEHREREIPGDDEE